MGLCEFYANFRQRKGKNRIGNHAHLDYNWQPSGDEQHATDGGETAKIFLARQPVVVARSGKQQHSTQK